MNNLKQIGLALHNYHDKYGSFPPAYIADESGKPMHSWRVLILPFMEHQALYDLYDFNEPWDGPNNSQLAAQMPKGFRCSASRSDVPVPGMTRYVTITGPGTAWIGGKSTKLDEITDGPANTLLVVESTNAPVKWMEPIDLDIAKIDFTVNSKTGHGISSNHPKHGAPVLFADGSIHFLPETISATDLQALLTIQAGDKVQRPDW